MRTLQYMPYLESREMLVFHQPLMSDTLLQERYLQGSYGFRRLLGAYGQRISALFRANSFDLIWIEKEALPWAPAWMELLFLHKAQFVLDYDDAIFHNYDLHRNPVVRWLYGKKLDGLMARARLVVAGNEYLVDRARAAGAPWVQVVPTVIDLERYPAPKLQSKAMGTGDAQAVLLRVVWIGSPSTLQYLRDLAVPLQALAARVPFVLRIIGGGALTIPGVSIEVVDWHEQTEVANIQSCAVGVMPLRDSPWERGKCGYKLIQYMACGLPVVASAVGVNPEIVDEGVNGFLARNEDEWVERLAQLLQDEALRRTMGAEGRKRVEERYCIQQTGPRLAGLLRTVALGPRAQGVAP